ncbi:DUF885 domain-containing protein [Longimicrobium sp.]|uniref:DUF885 domain-containing protein n=1 Tax=Longimicrobium sp. TaxID=2029185 RepID=UPI002E33A049|nr:DUF885 domain-containing protein [Longimicrobium sp.]HEX6037709.1 DUF885 domain-containing protein [Longimicrobium sp.]
MSRVRALADAYLHAWARQHLELAVYLGAPLNPDAPLPDNSLAGIRAWRSREDAWLAQVRAIDADALDADDRITLGVLRHALESEADWRVARPELWTVDQAGGWHLFYPPVARAQAVGTDAQRARALARWSGFGRFVANETDRLEEGVRTGWTAPRDAVRRVIDQLDATLRLPPDSSPYADPARRDPDNAFSRAWTALVADEIHPALARYRDHLRDEYLPRARTSLAISALPCGVDGYRAALRRYTTLALDPAEVHAFALAELDRAEAEMRPVALRALGTDDLAEARHRLRTSDAYRYASADEMLDHARGVVARAWERLPAWFAALPDAPVGVEPMPGADVSSPGGIYVPPADGRPGSFQANTHPSAMLTRVRAESVIVHETVPGHHLQLALARERGAHPLTRVMGNSGFVEGWAVYAESLAEEMGLYASDLSRLGWLSARTFYAAWAAVDSGIHALGWTREQAREVMRSRTSTAPERIDAMVDMAATWAGFAPAYLLGGAEIRRLRTEAEAALGADFDIRRFHSAVLEDGNVTLPMLRAKLSRWTAAPRAG